MKNWKYFKWNEKIYRYTDIKNNKYINLEKYIKYKTLWQKMNYKIVNQFDVSITKLELFELL